LRVQAGSVSLDRQGDRDTLLARSAGVQDAIWRLGVAAAAREPHLGHRASFATYVLMVLIVCLVFIIIDLDRPRRGLIEVSQQSLVDLWDRVQQTSPGATG
jgi:hypothetical protein